MSIWTSPSILSFLLFAAVSFSSIVSKACLDDEFQPGDSVEIEFLGEDYEGTVIEVESSGWLKVEFEYRGRAKIRTLPPHRVELIEHDSENPFVEAEKPSPLREWTDSTGKFKVKATMLSNSNGRIELKKQDGRIVTLPLKKLSDKDQKYLAKLALEKANENDPENPFAGGVPESKPKNKSQKSKRSGRSSFRELSGANFNEKVVEPELGTNLLRLSSNGWNYLADAGTTNDNTPAISFGRGFSSKSRIKRTRPLVLSEDKSKAATIVYDPFNKKESTVIVFDLVDGTTRTMLAIPKTDVKVIAVSNDGEKFLTAADSIRSDGVGFWTIKDDVVTLDESWKTADFRDRDGFAPQAGMFIGKNHLLTLGRNIVMWDIESRADLYTIRDVHQDSVAFSANNRFLSVGVGDQIYLVDIKTGNSLGSIDVKNSRPRTSFSSSGQFLAVSGTGAGTIKIWDLTNQEMIREISSAGITLSIEWIGDEFLLVNGSDLIDIASKVAVWKYTGVSRNNLTSSNDGRFWLLKDDLLKAIKLPHKDLSDQIEQLDPDSLLALKPGDAVDIEISLPFSTAESNEVKEHLEKRLEANGISIRPGAEIKVVAKVQKLKKETMELSNMMSPLFRRSTETVILKPNKAIVTIEKKGEQIWSRSRTYKPAGILHIENGESSQEAADRVCLPKKSFFLSVEIPATISRMPGGKPLGNSRLQ